MAVIQATNNDVDLLARLIRAEAWGRRFRHAHCWEYGCQQNSGGLSRLS